MAMEAQSEDKFIAFVVNFESRAALPEIARK